MKLLKHNRCRIEVMNTDTRIYKQSGYTRERWQAEEDARYLVTLDYVARVFDEEEGKVVWAGRPTE